MTRSTAGGKQKRAPKRVSETALDPEQSYRSAMRALIAHRWGELWRAVPAALAGTDPEGVHDVRVASRRLRAAMDVAGDCFPASWYRPLHAAAKEITGALGPLRDQEVLLDALAAEHLAAPPEEWPGLDRLVDRVEGELGAARVAMDAFFAELMARGIAEEAARRFGPGAAPPPDGAVAPTKSGGEASKGGKGGVGTAEPGGPQEGGA